MSDLAEEIRNLVDGCAAPVTLRELEAIRLPDLDGARRGARWRVRPVGAPSRTRWLVAASALVLVVAGAGAWSATRQPAPERSIGGRQAAPPSWQLSASLSGPQFQMGTGNPTGVEGVDCSGAKTCFLSTGYGNGGDASNNGSTYVSHDGGHTWAPTTLPTNVATTTLVSCVNTSWCAAGGGLADPSTGDPAAKKVMRDPELLMTSDGGTSWTMRAVPFAPDVQQLPAYNNLPAETTYWPASIDAVSCSAPGVCGVIANVLDSSGSSGILPDRLVFAITTDGGSTWKTSTLPELSDEAGDETASAENSATLSCSSASSCIAVAAFSTFTPHSGPVDSWTTTDGGQSWSETRIAAVSGYTPTLSCTAPGDCWAGPLIDPASGPSGSLLRTTDDGRSWSIVPLPRAGAGSSLDPEGAPIEVEWGAVGCTSSSQCYIAGPGMQVTTDGGTSWRPVTLPAEVGSIQSISCGTGSGAVCVAAANPPSGSYPNGGSLIITDGPAAGAT